MNLKLAVFSILFFAVFVYLGLWQLGRADEKVQLLEALGELDRQPAVTLNTNSDPAAGQRVKLAGQFEEEVVFLLDNRVLDGVVGYELLTPFRDSRLVITNRGFIPMERTRAEVPALPALGERGAAQGKVHLPEPNNLQGQWQPEPLADGVYRIQAADLAEISQILDEPVAPFIVRISADDPNGLPRHWPSTTMTPERHRGYALQWFTMALAILILFLYVSFKHD